MLVLRRKKGEAIKIGDNITVTVSDIGQDCVQIAIDAPREISILRSELAEAAKVNQESAIADRESIKNLKNMLKNQKDKTNT